MTRRSLCIAMSAALLAPLARGEEPRPIRVVVWDEQQPAQKQAYDNFLGHQIAAALAGRPGLKVKSARLDDPEQGLSKATLDACDVLIWWGHVRQREVKPETGREIVRRIKAGELSLIALHSAHWSTPFVEAMNERARIDARKAASEAGVKVLEFREYPARLGVVPKPTDKPTPRHEIIRSTSDGSAVVHLWLPSCVFPSYRGDGKPSHLRVLLADHPLAKGVPAQFDIPRTEMYDEPFFVPKPDTVVFEERWDLGEHFRSGAVWELGQGKVVYFRPGHETYPVFKQPEVLTILENATRWLGAKSAR